ncbi:hypothetical protein OEZ86_013367 [Tetradesmus obliquus]|nr:hypothetical protein OEZ86_013367 [Tetradesmus obliquus]
MDEWQPGEKHVSSSRVVQGVVVLPFGRLLAQRQREQQGQELQLAAALKYGSTGRMEPMWGELRGCRLPMLLVAGQLDAKFAGIKRRMFARLRQGLAAAGAAAEAGAAAVEEQGVDLSAAELGAEVQQQQGSAVSGAGIMHQWAEVPGAGHAVHVEAPLQLLQLVRGFMQQLQEP